MGTFVFCIPLPFFSFFYPRIHFRVLCKRVRERDFLDRGKPLVLDGRNNVRVKIVENGRKITHMYIFSSCELIANLSHCLYTKFCECIYIFLTASTQYTHHHNNATTTKYAEKKSLTFTYYVYRRERMKNIIK